MKELARIMVKSESDAARVAAIKEMFDRGYGKSPQAIVGGDETEEAIKHVVMWKNAGQ